MILQIYVHNNVSKTINEYILYVICLSQVMQYMTSVVGCPLMCTRQSTVDPILLLSATNPLPRLNDLV